MEVEDLTGVRIDEDDANMELQAALDKTRKLKQKKSKHYPDQVGFKFLKFYFVLYEEESLFMP